MVDLVVADALDQQYTQANGGKVSFNFKHTLSRISFKAKLGSGDFTGMDGNNSFVYITHMWIVGKDHGTTAESGNLSLTNLSAASNPGSKFYTSAKWSQLHWNYETLSFLIRTSASIISWRWRKKESLKPMPPPGTKVASRE